ncbi:putative ABC transport system ATP-binding protein [Clostridium amylolyticum]|uniref:Putative ABC transport system ATP-binding protein n=1 Tax=Clostridium amylolyticum TaxID=1121298 RepID=A0A1M6H8T0_9CLOT|nr:ABC transporter ATP-binding protein [Clostridium amylolyticum]SHJ18597.1 putative ABC transport system ATP-binding protein [Clostridium amylolyticum]
MSTLCLDNVSYVYEGTTKKVLNGVNADFQAGLLYCIIGKSGSGKSTLLSLISGLDTCTNGTVIYQGKDMKQIDRDEYRAKDIGVIFQGYNLLTNATALENVLLSMNISQWQMKDKKKYALELLAKVGIDNETALRKVLRLSGGEQQRVGIARAISHNPDIIIADEPTGNLDGDTEENIMSIFSSLAHDANKCVIIVTHSKSVSGYADELWGLNQGKLVFVK